MIFYDNNAIIYYEGSPCTLYMYMTLQEIKVLAKYQYKKFHISSVMDLTSGGYNLFKLINSYKL